VIAGRSGLIRNDRRPATCESVEQRALPDVAGPHCHDQRRREQASQNRVSPRVARRAGFAPTPRLIEQQINRQRARGPREGDEHSGFDQIAGFGIRSSRIDRRRPDDAAAFKSGAQSSHNPGPSVRHEPRDSIAQPCHKTAVNTEQITQPAVIGADSTETEMIERRPDPTRCVEDLDDRNRPHS
jgi:hypothetical protein